jgi:hypothetical protein
MKIVFCLHNSLIKKFSPQNRIIFILNPLFWFMFLKKDFFLFILPLFLISLVNLSESLWLDFNSLKIIFNYLNIKFWKRFEFHKGLVKRKFNLVPFDSRLLFSILIVPTWCSRSSLFTSRFASWTTPICMHRQWWWLGAVWGSVWIFGS